MIFCLFLKNLTNFCRSTFQGGSEKAGSLNGLCRFSSVNNLQLTLFPLAFLPCRKLPRQFSSSEISYWNHHRQPLSIFGSSPLTVLSPASQAVSHATRVSPTPQDILFLKIHGEPDTQISGLGADPFILLIITKHPLCTHSEGGSPGEGDNSQEQTDQQVQRRGAGFLGADSNTHQPWGQGKPLEEETVSWSPRKTVRAGTRLAQEREKEGCSSHRMERLGAEEDEVMEEPGFYGQ